MVQRLNSSPYHADILLVTITELDTIAVRKLFPNKLKHFIGDNTYYELGEVGGARVFLVRSEVGANGPGGAFATIDEGISLLSPSIVIMVGIAFGAAPQSQNIGDILVSEQIIEIEHVVSGPKGEPIIISRGDKALGSPRLIKRFKDGALEWREANEAARVRFGQICSGYLQP